MPMQRPLSGKSGRRIFVVRHGERVIKLIKFILFLFLNNSNISPISGGFYVWLLDSLLF